jgi:tRNA-dihydrouridine synthase
VAKRAQAVGVRAVTLHARTARQFYKGSADWDHIKALKSAIDIPVIGNGDLDDAKLAMERMHASGVDAIMIGRGALGNPWLISQIADLMEGREMRPAPSHGERLRFCIVHYRRMIDELGEARAVPQMRKHVALYLKGVPGGAMLRERMMRIPAAAKAIGVIEETIERLAGSAVVAA